MRIIGNMGRLPKDVQKSASNAEKLTAENSGLILNVALNYGGRDEIIHAVKAIIEEGVRAEDVTEEMISNHLYTGGLPDPD
ncbi:MAG: undecaprenyl diphosphate synthase family protein, partial [Eubacterium sp.]